MDAADGFPRRAVVGMAVTALACGAAPNARATSPALTAVGAGGPAIDAVRIRTGGQSGVDRAALKFVTKDLPPELRNNYGGWCPRGGLAEDAPYTSPPALLRDYPLLCETPSEEPAQRTAWNARDSHATLILMRGTDLHGAGEGTVFTYQVARLVFERPCLAVDISKQDWPESLRAARDWLVRTFSGLDVARFVLNVAGPRDSIQHGIEEDARAFLRKLFLQAAESP